MCVCPWVFKHMDGERRRDAIYDTVLTYLTPPINCSLCYSSYSVLHVYYMCITCILHVYYMHIACILHAVLHVYYMHIACCITCVLHVYYLYIH